MKKLLFNGCSFVAGDDIGWDYKTIGNPWDSKNSEAWIQHREDRKKFNLGAVCARILNTKSIDISEDGASNSHIALKTIKYLHKLSYEEKSKIHVCIGWTEPTRFIHYVEQIHSFYNVGLAMFKSKHPWIDTIKEKYPKELNQYVDTVIRYKNDETFMIEYLSNILLLENFLMVHNITYTFWRSLGKEFSDNDKYIASHMFDLNALTNHSHWVTGNTNDSTPIMSKSWLRYDDLAYNSIYLTQSHHPSSLAITYLSEKIRKKLE